MSKHNLAIKKIKKKILYINDSIENIFNNIRYFKSNYKKILLNKNNRVFIGVSIVVILTLSYFLIPTIYNKQIIQDEIKNQILKKYNIDIKYNTKINYGLLPMPHFSAKNLFILRDNKKIAVTKNLKVFIGIKHFLSLDKIKIKNLLFYKTDFEVQINDYLFFKNLLKTEPNDNTILFKKSNIFFKSKNDEVLFINKIKTSKFYYDSINLQNVLISSNEVFKVPFKLVIKNDKFNKKVFTKFNSKKIRLNVTSETRYDEKTKNGDLDILFINKNTSLNYQVDENSLNFISQDNRNFYKGLIDFKPFYLTANFNYDGLSTKNLLNDNSILIDLIKSEIYNNKNLSANLIFNIKDIININELNNLNLKILIEEGNLSFSDSLIKWKNDLFIRFNQSQLSVDDDGINLVGSVVFDFKKINNFYSSFQIQKKNRKNIKKIELDFVYNLNTKKFSFDNPRINELQNPEIEEFLYKFNSKEDRVFNKITFKNFVNEFFKVYAG